MSGPFTCKSCTSSTWNDDDMCDACVERARKDMEEAESGGTTTDALVSEQLGRLKAHIEMVQRKYGMENPDQGPIRDLLDGFHLIVGAADTIDRLTRELGEARTDPFKAGARAAFIHMQYAIVNNYHMNPKIQARLDEINDYFEHISMDALEELDPESAVTWKDGNELLRQNDMLKAERDAARRELAECRNKALEEAVTLVSGTAHALSPHILLAPDETKAALVEATVVALNSICDGIRSLKTEA